MGIYAYRDLHRTTSGDITLASNGDIKLAESDETLSGVVNFIVQTDRGEYVPDNRLGADLGSFIGGTITRFTLNQIEKNLIQNLTKFALNREDLQVHAIPLAHDEIGVIVGYGGEYIDKDGNVMDTTTHVINYLFPYLEGGPIPVS